MTSIGLAAGALLIAGLSIQPASAAEVPEPAQQSRASVDVAPLDDAVVSLMEDKNISAEKATQQMDDQVAAEAAVAKLPENLRKGFGGVQINHDRGGVVEIAVSDMSLENDIADHFRGFGVTNLKTVEVEYSDDELSEAIQETAKKVDPASSGIQVRRGESGKVTVGYVKDELTADEQSLLDAAREHPQLYSVEEIDEIKTIELFTCKEKLSEFLQYSESCDPPIRGGQHIFSPHEGPGIWPVCTSGFNVRGRTDNKPYILTAGHCYTGLPWESLFDNPGSGNEPRLRIGDMVRYQEQVIDSGIISVDDPDTLEFGKNWIAVTESHGEQRNEQYEITEAQNPIVGSRVCVAGGLDSFTSCGEVTSVDRRYASNEGRNIYDHIFVVDRLCVQPGDSGSPIYGNGIAYGTLTGGDNPVNCSTAYGQQIVEAQDAMDVDLITSDETTVDPVDPPWWDRLDWLTAGDVVATTNGNDVTLSGNGTLRNELADLQPGEQLEVTVNAQSSSGESELAVSPNLTTADVSESVVFSSSVASAADENSTIPLTTSMTEYTRTYTNNTGSTIESPWIEFILPEGVANEVVTVSNLSIEVTPPEPGPVKPTKAELVTPKPGALYAFYEDNTYQRVWCSAEQARDLGIDIRSVQWSDFSGKTALAGNSRLIKVCEDLATVFPTNT